MTSLQSGNNDAITTYTDFAGLLARLRRAARLSQMDLAFAAGLSTRHTNFLERGKANPSRATVRRLCKALRVEASTADRLMLAAGFAPDPSRHERLAAHPAVELQKSFGMAVIIGQQSSADSVLRLGSSCLRQLGFEDVFAEGDIDIATDPTLPLDDASPEALARRVARKLICDSVRETLRRLGANDAAVGQT